MCYLLIYGNSFLSVFWGGAQTGIFMRIQIVANASDSTIDTDSACGSDG